MTGRWPRPAGRIMAGVMPHALNWYAGWCLLFKPFVFIDAAMLVLFVLAYRKLSGLG